MPPGRHSWLPPLAFQQPLTRVQGYPTPRPLLMRSQTPTTSSSSVYSERSTPSESTICRYPSTTSSFSSLSYGSAIRTPVSSIVQTGNKPELPVIPERYRRYAGRYSDAGNVLNSTGRSPAISSARYWSQVSLPNAPQPSQEEIQFWPGDRTIYESGPSRCRYPISTYTSTEAILPRSVRTPSRRNSRIEKRRRSYERSTRGKPSIYQGTLANNSLGEHVDLQSNRVSGPVIGGGTDTAVDKPVLRRQSRTLVKKRQPWDSAPRCDKRSRV